MKAWGVILAAGEGARLGAGRPKAFRSLGGRSMIEYSIAAFSDAPSIDAIVDVVPGWLARPGVEPFLEYGMLVPGGQTRQGSVRNALASIVKDTHAADVDAVVIHDAARPLVTPDMIERALAGLEGADGVVCAVPLADTLKRAQPDGSIETVPRAELWRAQTPQAFRLDVLVEAHRRAEQDGFEATDDAALVEHYGGRVVFVAGDERNIKITTRADLLIAEALLSALESPVARSGVGYDAHAFGQGARALVLGGVTIPHERGLDGHSDADVLCHAIADAMLGAAALGDLGEHFPSSDPRWEGAAGTDILRECARMVASEGLAPAQVDSTLVIEEPTIAPHRGEMRKRIADALGIDAGSVSVKATTTDGIGNISTGDGAAAVAIVRLEPR